MDYLVSWLVLAGAVLIAAYIIPGVKVSGFFSALAVALALGIMNLILRPILIFFTLPLSILTLGLFIFVINAIIILLADKLVKGFEVRGFFSALLYSIVVSLINMVLGHFFKHH